MAYSCVRVYFEIGHEASLRSKRTTEGFTHDWEVFVRGLDNAEIHHFVDKVVFHLHDTFPKPKRTIKEPPYCLKESGYAGFNLPIDIYLKKKDEHRRLRYYYDLTLQPSGPRISNVTKEKADFTNPAEDFRRKLIRGGGVGVGNDSSSSIEKTNSITPNSQLDDSKSSPQSGKPKLNSISSEQPKKHKPKELLKPEESRGSSFAALFGTPIKTTKHSPTSKTKTSSSVELKNSHEKQVKDSSSSKISKHSPLKEKDKENSINKHKDKERDKEKEEKTNRDKERNKEKEHKEKDKTKDKLAKRSSSPVSKDVRKEESIKKHSDENNKNRNSSKNDNVRERKHKDKKHREEREKKEFHKEYDKKDNEKEKLNDKIEKKQEISKDKDTKEIKFKPIEKEEKKSKPSDREKDRSHDAEKQKHKHKRKEKHRKEDEKDRHKKKTKEKTPEPILIPKAKSPTPPLPPSPPPNKPTINPLNMLIQELSDKDSDSDFSISMEEDIKSDTQSEPPPKPKIEEKRVEIIEEREKVKKKEKKNKDEDRETRKRKRKAKDKSEPPEKISKAEIKEETVSPKCEARSESPEVLFTEDYVTQLKDLQQKIMTLQDNADLQRVVQVISETGQFEITQRTFDFDLCALDRSTVKRLQDMFITAT